MPFNSHLRDFRFWGGRVAGYVRNTPNTGFKCPFFSMRGPRPTQQRSPNHIMQGCQRPGFCVLLTPSVSASFHLLVREPSANLLCFKYLLCQGFLLPMSYPDEKQSENDPLVCLQLSAPAKPNASPMVLMWQTPSLRKTLTAC